MVISRDSVGDPLVQHAHPRSAVMLLDRYHIDSGWTKMYWEPLAKYLTGQG